MHKELRTRLVFAATSLVAAFAFSGIAHAINIGEVVSQSKLGEPLRTQIELTGSGRENVDDACLSLVAPDPSEEGAQDFLIAAKVTVKAEGGQRFAVISSHRSYNEPFLRIKLQVKCMGAGNVTKSFTILPEFAEAAPAAAPAVASGPGETAASTSLSSPSGGASAHSAERGTASDRAQSRPRRGKRKSHAVRETAGEAGQAVSGQHPSAARSARSKQGGEGAFRLRLSGEAIDESRIGKISDEERNRLRARQKLLDADDQMASFLALQNQVKQLQDELGSIKLKLSQTGVGMPAAAPVGGAAPAPGQPPQQVAEVKPQNAPNQIAQAQEAQPTPEQQIQNQPTVKQRGANQRQSRIQRGPILIGLLALLGLLFGLRYWLRIRAQAAEAKPVLKKRPAVAPAAIPPAPAATSARAPKPSMQTRIAQPAARPVGKAAAKPAAKPIAKPASFKAPAASSDTDTAAVPASLLKKAEPAAAVSAVAVERSQEELAEDDSIIEEAELYAIHGHPDRAIAILQELIEQRPGKTEAWLLMFSILSSLKKVAEFEQTARNFLDISRDNPAWSEIQVLGRTLDPTNVLYADLGAPGENLSAAAPQPLMGKRALLGDILLAMGALSIQDMDKCLSEFDPKVDGRFGQFLIKRNMITEAQLEAALLQQQLNSEANSYQPEEAPKPEEPVEPKKGDLPALEFEPASGEFAAISQSLNIDKATGS